MLPNSVSYWARKKCKFGWFDFLASHAFIWYYGFWSTFIWIYSLWFSWTIALKPKKWTTFLLIYKSNRFSGSVFVQGQKEKKSLANEGWYWCFYSYQFVNIPLKWSGENCAKRRFLSHTTNAMLTLRIMPVELKFVSENKSINESIHQDINPVNKYNIFFN